MPTIDQQIEYARKKLAALEHKKQTARYPVIRLDAKQGTLLIQGGLGQFHAWLTIGNGAEALKRLVSEALTNAAGEKDTGRTLPQPPIEHHVDRATWK